NAADVLLLVEVADTTLEKDRLVKLPLYAASGIPEYWIVNLQEQIVEVYQQASKDTYNRLQKYHLEDQIPLGPLDGSLSVKDFLA
ncbi:MAG: Uma2 family endonuclease, partial [Bacteroidota bacterium]